MVVVVQIHQMMASVVEEEHLNEVKEVAEEHWTVAVVAVEVHLNATEAVAEEVHCLSLVVAEQDERSLAAMKVHLRQEPMGFWEVVVEVDHPSEEPYMHDRKMAVGLKYEVEAVGRVLELVSWEVVLCSFGP